jgi:F-type H+-transporting ATPase subunit delta
MKEFLNEVARRRGEIVVEVFSPYNLDEKEEDDLKKIILNKTNGKNISLLTHIDSSLLGGLIVKYGSKMIDTSIRTKLNNLELAMKGAN